MADDLAVEFFKAARAQREQVTKWHLIVLAALLYFHVGIVAPFASKSAEKAEMDRNLAQQRAVSAAVAPVARLTRELGDQVAASAKNISETLLSDLVARFGKLNEVVATLTGMDENQAAGQAGEMLFSPPVRQQQQQQQRLQQTQSISLQPMPPDLRRLIAHYGDDRSGVFQYDDQLKQYIQEFVVVPSFEQANAIWASQFLPSIDGRIQAALSAIAETRTTTGEASAELADLEASIKSLREQAHGLRFTAPADAEWWRTVGGKEVSIGTMMQSLASGIESAARSQVSINTLHQKVAEAIRQEETSSRVIQAELVRLEEDARTLQSQLGEFGSPLKIVAFRLAVLAPLLPMIIAVASGIATLLTAEALRKMCLAISLVPPAERAKLRPWLADVAGRSRPLMTLRAIWLAALMSAWILSTLRVTGPLEPLFVSGPVMVALALVLLLACRFWLWLTTARALQLAEAAV